jgi:hypothetical protein
MSIEGQERIIAWQESQERCAPKVVKKTSLKNSYFKIGDKVEVLGDDKVKYLRGTIVHVTSKEITIRGKILKYSSRIGYPVGEMDLFKLKANGTRNVNGLDLITRKIKTRKK